MIDSAASRFPALHMQTPRDPPQKNRHALTAPTLPTVELAILLLAWVLILPTGH